MTITDTCLLDYAVESLLALSDEELENIESELVPFALFYLHAVKKTSRAGAT